MTTTFQQLVEAPVRILVLQHPQESRNALSSVPILASTISNATVKIGLSWKSLASVTGDAVNDKYEWVVLYLGRKDDQSKIPADLPYVLLNGKGQTMNVAPHITGMIILDGSWSQAKTLFFRNPWLKRLNRIVLRPSKKSLYGALRREPRKTAISTIEAAAMAIKEVTGNTEVPNRLIDAFETFVANQPKSS